MVNIPYTTDEALKSLLDSNQLARERICTSVLSSDRRVTNIIPMQPRGGADGGADIKAILNMNNVSYQLIGAVGFINSASDTISQRNQIYKKFESDLKKACQNVIPDLKCFVFFTNVALTVKLRDKMKKFANSYGISILELYDRERIRIFLDSVDGFSIRFQYLNIPLSEAEQATFFSKWGHDIQQLIENNFTDIKLSLQKLLFLQESYSFLKNIYVKIDLDRKYSAVELGHYRAFFQFYLKNCNPNLFILSGIYDYNSRNKDLLNTNIEKLGMDICSCQFSMEDFDDSNDVLQLNQYHTLSRINEFDYLTIKYNNSYIINYLHKICIKDFDFSLFKLFVNKSFYNKISKISVYFDDYHINTYYKHEIESSCEDNILMYERIPIKFSSMEVNDPWVGISPLRETQFLVSFMEYLPKKI